MENFSLLMPFIIDSRDFVHGFECGQIWEKMNKNEKFDNYVFHTENAAQIEMMCRRHQYKYRIDKIDDTWSSLFAELDLSLAN